MWRHHDRIGPLRPVLELAGRMSHRIHRIGVTSRSKPVRMPSGPGSRHSTRNTPRRDHRGARRCSRSRSRPRRTSAVAARRRHPAPPWPGCRRRPCCCPAARRRCGRESDSCREHVIELAGGDVLRGPGLPAVTRTLAPPSFASIIRLLLVEEIQSRGCRRAARGCSKWSCRRRWIGRTAR